MGNNALVGASGVHFVVAELLRKGWVAMPTIRNTKGIDVLASKDGKDVEIQVKCRENGLSWMLHESAEKLVRRNLCYAFVNLRQNEVPEYFVMPSEVVAEYVTRTHKLFLDEGGKDSTMRKLPNCYAELDLEKYRDKWELLSP